MKRALSSSFTVALICLIVSGVGFSRTAQPDRAGRIKTSAAQEVESLRELTRHMIDMIFSFGELGFQEFESTRYCVGILQREGFQVREGIAGIPTAWVATWGSGKPVVALGSDIDGLPQTSQRPGVAFRDPLVAGAPGHGEGHNSGVPLNITAAIAVKRLMEREGLRGTIRLWPGIAEEQLATKAYLVRAGVFKDVDVVLFAHVDSNMGVSWGAGGQLGLVSVEYNFEGRSAHAGAGPWRGRSALDAVELMNVGWNFRREHLRVQQRSHYVITNGGDQPNVVPPLASVWYFFREADYSHVNELYETGNRMAQAAAMMTDTSVSWRLLGSAWPGHFNKAVAEAMYKNIQAVGLPQWSEEDQALARAVQREIGTAETGLNVKLDELGVPVTGESMRGGGSDDIGDVSWNVPTVTLRYASNIPGLPGHNWANAVAMATPIAHKGATAGAKAMAMTIVDLLLDPGLVEDAWKYFREVQTRDVQYTPFITEKDQPAIDLNRRTMERHRPEMRKFYFDPVQYRTYLDQLGIAYPTIRH